GRKAVRGQPGVQSARKKAGLKEQEARRPDGGRAAEQRQQHSSRQRLDEKEQPGARKQREALAHAILDTSCVRVSTPTLSKTCVRCFLIVAGAVPSVVAMSRLRYPSSTSSTTCASRGESRYRLLNAPMQAPSSRTVTATSPRSPSSGTT